MENNKEQAIAILAIAPAAMKSQQRQLHYTYGLVLGRHIANFAKHNNNIKTLFYIEQKT